MHGHVPYDVFLKQISGFLGSYYLLLTVMNAVAAFMIWNSGHDRQYFRIPFTNFKFSSSVLWLLVSVFFLHLSPFAYSGDIDWMRWISLPEVLRDGINRMMNPTIYTLGSLVLLGGLFLIRRWIVKPIVAWSILNVAMLLMGMSLTDQNFAAIVTKPDNVPIVGMLFLVG